MSQSAVAVEVVIADDEPLVRSGLRLILDGSAVEVVGEAGDGLDALELARRCRPRVLLADLRMPRMDGIELTRRIRHDPELDDVRVVVLTTFAEDDYLVRATQAGADGYLLKSMPPEDIVAGVAAAARGQTVLAPALVQRLLAEHVHGRVTASPAMERLTAREIDVLRLIAVGRSNLEIAHTLFVGEGTVKTHVASILRKLSVRDRVQAAIAAYEQGLVRPGEQG
ncbi:response regulator [Longivirga aurantiaca]|uniref:Response regulator n=1 Tax=Longivirga aurantiaca TaxID=1837743 RepID=A0ABW1SVG0_9ACTN